MPHNLVVGSHVWADFGNHPPDVQKFVLGHVTVPLHKNADGEEKVTVQAPDGSAHELGYREPADFDEHGSGLTFHPIG